MTLWANCVVKQLETDRKQLEADKRQLEADKRQLEIDLDEAHRLQRATTTGPIEMLPVPRVTQSQVLATSILRMTLGSAQSLRMPLCNMH